MPPAIAPNARPQQLTVTPLHAKFAAEITGLDLAGPVEDATIHEIATLLGWHGVLVFPGQSHLTPAQHVAFSRRFGPLEVHVQARFLLKDHPEVLVVSNVIENGQPIGLADAGRYWHADLSYKAEPSLASLLLSRELPAEGGDTLFASNIAAYDALDPVAKLRLAGLTAVHDYGARNAALAANSGGLRPALTAEQARKVPPVAHPVVRRHEVTREPALFVSEGFTTHIVELSEQESRDLLARLFTHQTEPRFRYRHKWRAGDLVMWDNRSMIHLATGAPEGHRRTLHRTTIRGPVPRAFP